MSTQGETMTIDEAIDRLKFESLRDRQVSAQCGDWPDCRGLISRADAIDTVLLALAEARKAAVPWRDGGARGAAWPWGDDTVSPGLVYLNCTQPIVHAMCVIRDEWDYISSYMVEADVLQAVRAGRK